jgi:hypothetical protein
MSTGRFSKNDVSMTCRTKLDEVQQAAVSLMQGAQSNGYARCDCVDADVHKRVLKAMETYNQAVQHACGETDKAFESFVKVRSTLHTQSGSLTVACTGHELDRHQQRCDAQPDSYVVCWLPQR